MHFRANRFLKIQKTVHYCAVFWFIFLLLFFPSHLTGQNNDDSIKYILPDLEVIQKGISPIRMREDGSIKVKSNEIRKTIRSFGEADFLNQMKKTSLVHSSSDYSSGLSIDGDNGSQAQYLIGGAPVIFPYRFGGIFSTFNTSHFSSMLFSRTSSSNLAERLGASFEFEPMIRFTSGIEGLINIGMTSSSFTLRSGISNRISINLSARVSYIDEVYGKLLSGSSSYLKYNFYDLNSDLTLRITDIDFIKAGFFYSKDKVGYEDNNYSMNTILTWNNTLYNFAYSHKGDLGIEANLFKSSFNNLLCLSLPQFQLTGPSAYNIYGLNIKIGSTSDNKRITEWNTGFKISYEHSHPQYAILNMIGSTSETNRASSSITQKMCVTALFGDLSVWLIPYKLKLKSESSIGIFSSQTKLSTPYRRLIFTPNFHFLLFLPQSTIHLSTGWRQQTVHQVGFSELGLSSNFWIGANSSAPIQHSFYLSCRYTHNLPFWNLKIEVSGYLKKLRNQTEYRGEVMEVIDTDYNPFSHLIVSNGYNYGVSIGVSRQFSKITGDISYSFDDGWRYKDSQRHKLWHSLNSGGNSMRCNIIWHEGKHWTLSSSWIITSGRRYTPVEALYLVGGNIAMKYGEINSARLPLYQRLDLGASFYFVTGRKNQLRHSLNFSILNAYGHKNVEMQYFLLDSKGGEYSLKQLYSLYRFLPSLSYSIEF